MSLLSTTRLILSSYGRGQGRLSSRFISLIKPPGTPDVPDRTVGEVVRDLTETVIGGPASYDPELYKRQRERLIDLVPKSQEELAPRRMTDSFDQAIIPLGSDTKLRDRYTTFFGGVRVGRLLEDMDIFAVHLVFKHMLISGGGKENPQSPFSIVTALVDSIDVRKQLSATQDIKMMGHVTWVGKSSAESTLQLFQLREGKWIHVTDANFVLVVRDPMNKGSSFVNPMAAETHEEKDLFNRGESNKIARLGAAGESLFKHPPSEEEKRIIHDFFIKTVDHKALSFKARVKPENSVWMEDAKLKTIIVCQPENRNRFNKIFGGFIMRKAFELAWANAYVYGCKRPFINHMDDILFRAPVDVGSLLYMNSQICFTEDDKIQVRVSAEVIDPSTGKLDLTNVFQYTFDTKDEDDVPMIIPKTYHEAMMYLEGRRHFLTSVSR